MAAFQPVIRDTVALRDQLASGKFGKAKVNTAGALNVHPGLVGASAVPFRDALKGFLEKHLVSPRLTSMAVMGLAEPEPWIFIAMQKVPLGAATSSSCRSPGRRSMARRLRRCSASAAARRSCPHP